MFNRKQVAVANVLFVALLLSVLAACQTMTGKTAGENVDDATVTASVKSRLVADKISNLTRVDVDTNNGVVALNGVVASPQDKSRAEDIAGKVSGVKKVINNLQVQKQKG